MELNEFNRAKYNNIESNEQIFLLILKIRKNKFDIDLRKVKEWTF